MTSAPGAAQLPPPPRGRAACRPKTEPAQAARRGRARRKGKDAAIGAMCACRSRGLPVRLLGTSTSFTSGIHAVMESIPKRRLPAGGAMFTIPPFGPFVKAQGRSLRVFVRQIWSLQCCAAATPLRFPHGNYGTKMCVLVQPRFPCYPFCAGRKATGLHERTPRRNLV